MKKSLGALILTASLASAGAASADTITYSAEAADVSTMLNIFNRSLALDITYDPSLWASVSSAFLTLDLSDDGRVPEFSESAAISIEGGNSISFLPFDGSPLSWSVNPLSLLDGTLNFVLARTGGDFLYHNATLTVNFTPVPEASTSVLLGSGLLLAGLALRRRVS